MVRLAGAAGLVSRFALAGAANTGIGFLVIAGLDLGLGLDPRLANAAGYLVGLGVGFGLNRAFVFRSAERATATGPRFLLAAAAAFALNQAMLMLAGHVLGAGGPARLAAQLLGMSAYTAAMFLACRLWVFRPRSAAA